MASLCCFTAGDGDLLGLILEHLDLLSLRRTFRAANCFFPRTEQACQAMAENKFPHTIWCQLMSHAKVENRSWRRCLQFLSICPERLMVLISDCCIAIAPFREQYVRVDCRELLRAIQVTDSLSLNPFISFFLTTTPKQPPSDTLSLIGLEASLPRSRLPHLLGRKATAPITC